jgi:F-type H+-transporting ATPase subunit b
MTDSSYEALATGSQVVASALFIIALVILWRKYLTPAVLASQARKNAELADAEARRDAARAETTVAQAEVLKADDDARVIRARAQTDATRTREKILAEATSEAERLARNADGELERGRSAARDRLRTDLLEKAMQIAREASAHLDEATNRRLVGEAVDTAERGNA